MDKNVKEVQHQKLATHRTATPLNNWQTNSIDQPSGRGRSDSQGASERGMECDRNLLRIGEFIAVPKQETSCGGMRLELNVARGIAEGSAYKKPYIK